MSDFNANNAGIVGLTIDYGSVVNKKMEKGRLDALVVVYPNIKRVVDFPEGKQFKDKVGKRTVVSVEVTLP